jgi:hypothetical protein
VGKIGDTMAVTVAAPSMMEVDLDIGATEEVTGSSDRSVDVISEDVGLALNPETGMYLVEWIFINH